jgi:hypothetical protein
MNRFATVGREGWTQTGSGIHSPYFPVSSAVQISFQRIPLVKKMWNLTEDVAKPANQGCLLFCVSIFPG